MPHAPNNHRRFALGLGVLAALAGGGALGWWFGPIRARPPAVAPLAAPAKPAPISQLKPAAGLAFDLSDFHNPSLQHFVDLEAWLAGATCEEVWSLLDRGRRAGHLGYSPLLDHLLIGRFRAFSPGDRLAVVLAHADSNPRSLEVDSLVLLNLMTDLLPARADDAAVVSKFVHDFQGHQTAMALDAWAKQDFDAALAFAQSLGHADAPYVARLIRHLAATDLTAAQSRVAALPSGAERDEAMVSVASVMAKTNVAEAVAWVIGQGGGAGRVGDSQRFPATELLTRVAFSQPAAVADVMRQHPELFEGPGGLQAVRDIFGRWVSKDPQAAADWLRAHPLPESHQASAEAYVFTSQLIDLPDTDVVNAWRSQPEAVQNLTLRMVAARIAEGDPATLLDRVAAAFPEARRAEALRRVLDRVPDNPPDQILRWLPDLAPHFAENTAHDHLLTSLPEKELESTLARLPDAHRRAIQERLAEGLIREDPARALAALPPIEPNKENPFVYSHLATELLKSDPAQAADWVAGFAEGTSKEWAAQNLVASWGKFDPDAATTWVQNLPPGPSRDRASIELAFLHGLTSDVTRGVELAAAVQDPNRRIEAAGFALQSLWRRHPLDAHSALARLGLSAEHQQSLRTRLAQGEFVR